MRLSSSDLTGLAEVALAAADEAGRMIATTRPVDVEHKSSGATLASQVVTDVDHASEAIIVGHLAPTVDRYDLGLLTEERADDGGRFRADHFWCVDPIDGTLAFIEGRPGYAVSIALVRHDGVPLIGVVNDPATGVVRHAVAGGGAFLDGRPWRPAPVASECLSVFADRSLVTDDESAIGDLEQVAADLGLVGGVDLRVGAGAVMNACGALDRPPGCYVKFPSSSGGGHVWDMAATACLYGELGAVATDIHGGPLDLNRPDGTSMGHRGVCFATDETLATRLRALHRG